MSVVNSVVLAVEVILAMATAGFPDTCLAEPLPISSENIDTILYTYYTPAYGNGDPYFPIVLDLDTGLEPISASWSGRIAACTPYLFGKYIYSETLNGLLLCGDNFNESVNTIVCHPVYGMSMRVDVFYYEDPDPVPYWSGWYITESR